MARKETIAEAVKCGWHQPLVRFPCGPQPALPQPQLALCFPQLVSESCPRLTFLKLSDCHGVTPDTLIMLAKACPQLHSLDIQHSTVSPGVPRGPKEAWAALTGTSVLGLQVESTAVVSFLEEAGPRMRKLWLTYSSQTTAILGALLVGWSRAEAELGAEPGTARPPTLCSPPPLQGSCCPQLQLLEVSTGLNHNSTPLQLPVEALQKGCPQLQVPAAPPLPPVAPSPPAAWASLPGVAAAEPHVASQAFRASDNSWPRLPQPRGALPCQLHLQLCEQRGPGPPAPRLPSPALAGSPWLCSNHTCWPA